jgi:SAM-dependent methyltransferase
MPPDVLDFRFRAELTERMDEACSRDELRACLRDLARLNRWFLGYRPVLHWLDSLGLASSTRQLHILDVGSGYGDGLRRVERWANARGLAVELTGLDLNPDATAIAAEVSPAASRIEWVSGDIFAYTPGKPIDIVLSSLFAHHLVEADIVQFLRWMEENAEAGWFINDLSRSAIPYHLINAFSRVAMLHPFVQNDAPVSFRRSFLPEDWRRMCAAAGLRESDFVIRGFTPARLCIARRKPQ